MENTQQQKTPEMWFQALKEPYRSKAIKAIVFNHDKRFDSLLKALMNSTSWISCGFEDIVASLNAGETTYLEPETLKSEPIELRPEEETDWEAKYKELENVVYEQSKLIKRLQNELQEPKGEKVYFYFNEKTGHIGFNENLDVALKLSPQGNEIYQAVCIGKKKSVLVNE